MCDQRGYFDAEHQLLLPGQPLVPYPFPLGNMIVGTVTEIGAQVTKLKPGDRVLAFAGFCEIAHLAESSFETGPPAVIPR